VTDDDATVRGVFPGDRAGIRAGDPIRLGDTPFPDRSYVSGPGTNVPLLKEFQQARVPYLA
jgi:hypothetical protein